MLAWVALLFAAAGCGHAARPGAPRFDVAPWIEDYLQLREALSTGYANLAWAIERRGIDPFALNERTLQALRRARSEQDTLWALLEFVAVFADPHLQIDVDAHPVHGNEPRYPLRLRADVARVVVREIDTARAPGCRLRPGDEITSVAGKPIADEVRRFGTLVGSIDPDGVIAGALHLMLRSSFTPRDGLTVTGLRGSEPLSCRLTPIPAETSPPPAAAGTPADVPWTAAAETVCLGLGFQKRPAAFAYPLPSGAVPVTRPGDAFPAAILTTPAGRRIGFLRIASFEDVWQHDACVATWNHLRERQIGPDCDRDCLELFAYFAVRQAILEQVAAAVEALEAHGVAALVVDILHNGGGNDWAEDVALMLSPREPACSAMAVIRHPHWSRRFAEDLRGYEAALGRDDLAGDERSLITRARDHARHMLAETRATCDLRRLWTEPGHRPACSLIARSEDHLCGADDRRLHQVMYRQAAPALVWDERAPAVGRYTGPLFVLVDRHTASASEQFLGRLKEAGRGVVIGQRTIGAGCGYTNGGLDVVLENSGLRVKMPDCVRYLHGGENEVAGISPDIPLATRDYESPAFLARVLAALDEALAHGS